jgi:hypothetical protein
MALGSVLIGAVMGLHDATADTVGGDNAYTWGEFMNTSAGQARGNVEGQWGCGCSGHVVDRFRGDDFHLRKVVRYEDGDASSVYITYRVDGYGTYRVERRMFATDGEGYSVPFRG